SGSQVSPAARKATHSPRASSPAALNRGTELARGAWVAFLAAGETWDPERLHLICAAGQAADEDAVADVERRVRRDGSSTRSGHGLTRGPVEVRPDLPLSRLVVRRTALVELGGFDEELPAAWDVDLVVRLAP